MKKKNKINLQYLPLVIAAILAGSFIGILMFVAEKYIGFSIIIFFSLAYGYILYRIVEKIFNYKANIWNSRIAIVAVILAIIAVPLTFYTLDYKHMENIAIQSLAEDGVDVQNAHLALDSYIKVRSESSSIGPLLMPMIGFSGVTFIVDFIEFVIIGYIFYLGVRSKIYFKEDEDF